jgi:membrane protease YdiL (CAAX protease family)
MSLTEDAPDPNAATQRPQGPKRLTTGQEATALVLAATMLAVVNYHGPLGLPASDPHQLFVWFGVNVVCLLVIPALLVTFVWKRSLANFGLSLGDWRWWLKPALAFLAVMVPVIVIASRWPSFQSYYPRYGWARHDVRAFLLSEAGWLAYFLAWEFFYRGFLLFALAPRLGALAIFVQMLPFVMTHFPKPEAEAFSAIIAGVALGAMSYYGRSCVGTWLLHWTVAALMDAMVVIWPVHPPVVQ